MRRSAPIAAVVACAICSALAPVSAQRVVSSVDLSGTGVWYADSVRSMGGSISPAVRVDWSRGTVNAFANVSQLDRGASSIDGTIAPSLFTPSAGPFTAELAGSFGGSTHQNGTRTGQALALARGYVMARNSGAWIGAGAGRTWDGAVWRSVRQAEAGTWIESGGATMLATITPVSVGGGDTTRYTDFQAAVRYPTGVFEIGVSAGARAGSVGPAVGGTSRAWGSASVAAWVAPRVALVANGGTYPVDLTQGYPGGRFFTVALRLASRNARPLELGAQGPTSPVAGSIAGSEAAPLGSGATASEFELRTVSGVQRSLRVYAPAAHAVEINGDFTGWQPIRLTRGADGWWTASRSLPPGTYQINLRMDGGPWLAPPGLLTASDEFGGVVGILTIE